MRRKVYLIGVILVLLTCNIGCKKEQKKIKGGVVLTFDDHYVDDWAKANSLLSKYNWKATFCLSGVGFSEKDFRRLKKMEALGHEIAGHGLEHRDASVYVQSNGLKRYVEDEIEPQLTKLNQKFTSISSFAYPYGARNDQIDSTLFSYFKVLRATTIKRSEISKMNCFFDGNKLVYGLCIDSNSKDFSKEYVLQLLEYAKENKSILILYSHVPVSKLTKGNQTEMSTLEMICDYVENNNMQFYTLSDLAEM